MFTIVTGEDSSLESEMSREIRGRSFMSGGLYGKRAIPISGGLYGKRVPMSGGLYGKRRLSLLLQQQQHQNKQRSAEAPVAFSGGIYGKRGIAYSGGLYG